MVASAVAICNNALIELGADTISSLSETSTEAVSCNTVFDRARQAFLRSHPWNFAIKQSAIQSPLVGTPNFRYTYQFQLPSDCLRLMRVYESADYKVQGRNVYTDDKDIYFKYVYDNTDYTSWDALAADAFIANIRFLIAKPITGSANEMDIAANIFAGKLEVAKNVDASEDIEDEISQYDNQIVSARYI